ncbi:MAG: preprotein translocase subunit SecE [Eubacteriales bacterium]|jgi:preprotein translocase subunit SecE
MADKETVKAVKTDNAVKTGKEVSKAADKDAEKKKYVPVKPVKEKVKLKVRIATFIRDYRSELKKIVWPTFKQLTTSTKIVVVAIALMGIAVGVVDFLFSKGILLLGGLL